MMTSQELIADAEARGITRGYDYPGFSMLCREDRRILVAHFAAPAPKPEPKPEPEDLSDLTLSQRLDIVAPIDDMPHIYRN